MSDEEQRLRLAVYREPALPSPSTLKETLANISANFVLRVETDRVEKQFVRVQQKILKKLVGAARRGTRVLCLILWEDGAPPFCGGPLRWSPKRIREGVLSRIVLWLRDEGLEARTDGMSFDSSVEAMVKCSDGFTSLTVRW